MYKILKFESKKMFYNPLSLILSFGIPIMATIFVGIFTKSSMVPGSNIKVIDYCFPGYVLLLIFSLSGLTVSMIISNDRIEKRIKQIALSNISIMTYISSVIVFNLILFYIGFFIMLIPSIIFFNLTVSINNIFTLLLFPIIVFGFISFLFMTFANLTNNFKSLMTVIFILFYASIFLSGATIPLFMFPDWWKYINYVFPPGLCVLLFNGLVNKISFAHTWYLFVIFVIYISIFSFLAIKTFNWE